MGLLPMKFTYCRMVSALILPMILANKPIVVFALFLMTKNWSVSCENIVSILFLAFAVIELSPWHEIGNAVLVLLQFIVEQPFLTINGLGLSRQGQCHYFQVRKLGNRTTAWNITRFIDEIFRELFAYLKYFDDFCIKVVHTMG